MTTDDLENDACCQAGVADATVRAAEERRNKVRRVFWITLGLNSLVAVSKALYSYVSGSLTLGADSLHAVLDASSNVLALFSLGWAAAPADPRHPYGRQKIEILAALGIGVLIVVGLLEFAEAAIRGLHAGRMAPHVGWAGFAIVLATMGINLFVARYEHHQGHELHSELLHADAHHATSDFYASGAVLASFIGVRLGIGWADGAATLLLVVLIWQAAWKVFRDNIPILIDAARLDPDGVAELARSVSGVSDVHRVRSRGMRRAVELDLHLEVDPDMSVIEAHRLAQQIEREVKVKFPEVSDVIIHVEPRSRTESRTEPQTDSRR
ncbi:MAG TPA: cation diffusion facilitator family transporter [Polyangia bacterium]|jgi:cation diffusion facilitator family transporter|nr:cation diffusion facilitator family transporter [Polyangia bacterium]